MELSDYKSFCSDRAQYCAQQFKASLKIGVSDEELLKSISVLIEVLNHESEVHIQYERYDKAEKCLTFALKALEIAEKTRGLNPNNFGNFVAVILSNRSLTRHVQRKYLDAQKDAINSINHNPQHIKGYWSAFMAHKSLSEYPKAAYFLILALARNLVNFVDFVDFILELSILVAEMRNSDKEEFDKYGSMVIQSDPSLYIWDQIVQRLSGLNKFEALAIITTGVCESCCITSSVVHKLASRKEISFGFLHVGNMLKFLAVKEEGPRSWHLKLAEFAVQKGANIMTVKESFQLPFLIAITALSIEGELPSFLSLAWKNITPIDYDQKDDNGNTALHIVTKHRKCLKPTSVAIITKLLDNGCLANETDKAGQFPHEYISPQFSIHTILVNATKNPGSGVQNRLEFIRSEGNKAFKEQHFDSAIELYKKALHITLQFTKLSPEAAKIYGNISAAYIKKGDFHHAVKFAEDSLKADAKFCKGYFRKGQALLLMDKHIDACKAFISGFHQTSDESLKMEFSTEVAKLLHCIPDVEKSFLIEIKQVCIYKWPEKLKSFTEKGLWAQVKSLFLGPPKFEQFRLSTGDRTSLVDLGIMADCDASQAVLSTIFKAVESNEVEAPSALLTYLLQSGASPESLASQKETHFHAAVKFCILTSSIEVLKIILDKDKEKVIQSCKDSENRTPLHTLCLESEKRTVDLYVCENLAKMLAEKNVDFNAKDNYKRVAADYIIKRPPFKKHLEALSSNWAKFTRDKTSSGAEKLDTSNELKIKGNTAFKNAEFQEAFNLYSQAIEQLELQMQNSPYESWRSEDGRNLAILYGNRAECSFKLGDMKMSLKDAKKSVDADGSWYKSHWRVAKACRELEKGKTAIKAYINSLKAHTDNDGNNAKICLVMELVEILYLHKDDQHTTLTALNEISVSLMPEIAYSFIEKEKWHLAEFLLKSPTFPQPLKSCNFNMKSFCNKNLLPDQRWVCTLLVYFLVSGADHRNLKFHTGDTYFHAIISIIVLSGCNPVFRNKPMETEATPLLTYVMEQKVIPSNAINILDDKGNTVLHHLATLKGPDKMREFLANYLIDQGVDVTAYNYEKKQVIQLVSNSDVIKNVIQVAVDKNKSIYKMKEQKKSCSNEHSKIPASVPKTENETEKAAPMCNVCKQKLEILLKNKNLQEVFSKLVQVVNCKYSTASHHKTMTDQAIDGIVSNLANNEQDIPSEVLKLSAKNIKGVLTSLALKGCWTQVEMLVIKFRQKKGQHALPDFAKNMSLEELVCDKLITVSTKLNLIDLFVHGGIIKDATTLVSALQSSIHNSQWKVALKLLDLGADPCGITLNDGDTPYHAALHVALYRQPGYFELMKKLKALDESGKTDLDVSCQDSSGNTLLHIAAQAKFNQHSLSAVELLCNWNVLADKYNGEGKLAVHYLPSDKDRRAQYLKRAIVSSNLSSISKQSQKLANEIAGKNVLEVKQITSQQPANSALRTSRQMGRDLMEKKLLALPDVSFNFLTKDNRVNKKESVLEDQIESESSNEESDFQDLVYEITDDSAQSDIDIKAFDNLEWEIECTEEVWNTLRSKREVFKTSRSEQCQEIKLKQMFPCYLKELIVKKIQQVASGVLGFHTQNRVPDTPASLQLFKIELPSGMCILWELAIAFSPRLTESGEAILLNESEKTRGSAAKGSKIYSELIRLWSIVLKNSKLQQTVQKIIDSHQRGKNCLVQKRLELQNSDLSCDISSSKRIPKLYIETYSDETGDLQMIQGVHRYLFPPASAHKNEFHVLKFYSFSSSMVSAVLNNTDANADFPFRVTDIEHAFISLKSTSPLLLLGRSGTGKTTCCLYRMWSMFLHYWEEAIECGSPTLQRRIYPPELPENDNEDQETLKIEENKNTSKQATETNVAHHDGDFRESYGADNQKENGSENEDRDSDGESAEDSGVQYDHLHQLFVTKNPVLCSEVQKNFRKLCNGTEFIQTNNIYQTTELPNTLEDVGEFSFPVFLTSRQLLLMLDASVDGIPFFPRDEDLALKVTIPGWGTQEDIFNIIPLESNDLFDDDDDDNVAKNSNQTNRPKNVHALGTRPERKMFNRRECTYDVFTYEVWPKLIKQVQIDCHPSLVWTEIMSFIKGSYEALQTEKGFLDKEKYEKIGRKRAPNFTANRSQVYDIFIKYQHYKQQHALFDEADLVFTIFCRLRTMRFQPWVLHEIYVDETQDFTQAELALLVSLCSQPNKMFLTGDTAQSIMRGISFRFDDLRSLFYSVKKSALKSEQHLLTLKVPQKVHQLTHNYRSHTGILSLASSVLDILMELFKDSFDPLEKDQGMFAGPKPIIIESSSPGDLALLLTGSRRKTSHIEFGAHQAVLVVSEKAKSELPEELGAGIVLTIYESKGLEFDDVLIYNFFKDSQARKEWRVVANFFKGFEERNVTSKTMENLVEIDADVLLETKTRPLTFDPNQHKVLNSELKHLYTAITRARVNVWIFDEDEEKRAPMFEYFRAHKLVKCMGTQECANVNDAILFADKSTAKEWKLAGDKYMQQKLFTVAAKCYRLAEQPHNEKVALAYQTALEASRLRNNLKEMKDSYYKAGVQFVECDDLHHAALCFQNSQDFFLSAIALEKIGKFEDASSQYLRVQKANESSRCLEQAGMFGRAIRILVDYELFDRALDCLRRYQMEIQTLERDGKPVPAVLIENRPSDKHSADNLCYRSANYHYKNGDMDKAKAAISRLENVDDQIPFLKEHGFWEEATEILIREGETEQAAQFMLIKGDTDKALEYAQQGFHREMRAFIHLVMARKHKSQGDNLKEIQANATKALNLYIEQNDLSGQAQAKFLLGKHQNDEKYILSALQDFKKTKPANQAAELECLLMCAEVKYGSKTLKYCQEVIKIITLSQNILNVLLKQNREDADKYRLYMNFYGFEIDSVRRQVTWYHNHHQLCNEFLTISHERTRHQFETLDEAFAVSKLGNYLMSKIVQKANEALNWLEEQKCSNFPCIRMQEGQLCSSECKFMHRNYESNQQEIDVLNLLITSVHLDYCLQTIMEQHPAKSLTCDISLQKTKWASVEELLDFILPAYPSAQRCEHEHLQELMKTVRNQAIKPQLERYFLYLWNNPGRIGKGLSKNVLKERCKSTKWIVKAYFFSSLLRLKLDVQAEVKSLEVCAAIIISIMYSIICFV